MQYNSTYTKTYLLGLALASQLLNLPTINHDDVLAADLISKGDFIEIDGNHVVCIFDAYYWVHYD